MCVATLAVIGTTVSAASSVLGGISSAQAMNYQAQVAKNNAAIAQSNATRAAGAGASQAEQASLRASQHLSGIRAEQGALGVNANTGSAADVEASQRALGGLDSSTVSNNAALEVYGYRNQSDSFLAQSKMDRAEANWDVAGGVVKGAGQFLSNPAATQWASSLMSGSSSVGDNYSWMQSGDSSEAINAAAGFG